MALFRHLKHLPIAFHDQWPGGQLLSRSMTDLGQLRRWMSFGLIMLVVNTTTIGVGIGLMVHMGGILGLAYLCGALPVVFFSYRFSQRFRRISRLSQDQAGDLANTVEESVHGIRVLKAFGRGREAYQSFSAQADELRSTELSKARTLGGFTFAITTISEAVLGACLLLGSRPGCLPATWRMAGGGRPAQRRCPAGVLRHCHCGERAGGTARPPGLDDPVREDRRGSVLRGAGHRERAAGPGQPHPSGAG